MSVYSHAANCFSKHLRPTFNLSRPGRKNPSRSELYKAREAERSKQESFGPDEPCLCDSSFCLSQSVFRKELGSLRTLRHNASVRPQTRNRCDCVQRSPDIVASSFPESRPTRQGIARRCLSCCQRFTELSWAPARACRSYTYL
jgi:hypothetical protein